MKRLMLSTAASLAAMATLSTQAQAAEVVLVEQDGSLTGEFGDTITSEGMFESTFTFQLPEAGMTSAEVSTVRVSALTDIDFSEVLLNGVAFTLGRIPESGDSFEFGFITLPTMAGPQELIVRGTSGGNASFSGTIAFTPDEMGAVPEPGTWALMLLGFAAVGFGLRRNKADARETRVRYNFA